MAEVKKKKVKPAPKKKMTKPPVKKKRTKKVAKAIQKKVKHV
tara:strand:- start:5797 stop:5922 length:126 start_codon:yes stop_codon:yes gene_type:complete